MYLQHGMNTIDSTKLIELADADYAMLKEKGKEGEKVLHYNGFLDGFARGLHEGSNPWHKASEELPKMRHFTADGDFSDLCVCINETGEHKILVLCENSDYTYWAYGYDGEGLYDDDMDGEITHWMPIPEIKED